MRKIQLSKINFHKLVTAIDMYNLILDNLQLLPDLHGVNKRMQRSMLEPCIDKMAYQLIKNNHSTVGELQSGISVLMIKQAIKHRGTIGGYSSANYVKILTDKRIKRAIEYANARLIIDIMSEPQRLKQSDVDSIEF